MSPTKAKAAVVAEANERDDQMLPSRSVCNIEIHEGGRRYRAVFFMNGRALHVVGEGATHIMSIGGLPPKTAAKLVLQSWVHAGAVAPMSTKA